MRIFTHFIANKINFKTKVVRSDNGDPIIYIDNGTNLSRVLMIISVYTQIFSNPVL